ncbi:hypothetical protein ACIBEA_38650 [Streptomyces sp. NPDC051555]|uniref:hypothetical protein n=1 Tax=Streptomyces sp. NPDC051555 TaxID=3365657 RepID=UPI0037914995
MSATFTTQAGSNYSYTVETDENGETVYNLTRVFGENALAIGSVVVHPDYDLTPAVPGLLNIQFGKGSTDRHERTDVPMLGGQHDPYVIGHQLVNPADLVADPDAETPVTDPKINITRTVRAAQTETGTSSFQATTETFKRVQDLITALVTIYQGDKNTPKRAKQYAAFLNTQRAEKIQPELDAIDAQMKILQLRKAELTEKLNGYNAA